MTTPLRTLIPRLLAVATLAALVVPSLQAQAVKPQDPPADPAQQGVLHACYVPPTGLVYRIKGPGLPAACLAESHVAFSWAVGNPGVGVGLGQPPVGIPSQNWSLFGNRKTDATKDKLGTTDYQDLVLVTDNKEALRVTADGDIKIANSLDVGKDLTVRRNVYLNTASGQTINNGNFTVANGSATRLSGTLGVTGATTLDNTLAANGQVTIDVLKTGGDGNYDAYPLRVQGSAQGVAIRVNGSRNRSNNFVSFFDASGMHGRIEGQTSGELSQDPEYVFQNAVLAAQEGIAIANEVAAGGSVTPIVGFAGPVPVTGTTLPIPSWIGVAAANLVVQTAQLIAYNAFRQSAIGVTYQSSAGDYAEWLPKATVADRFYPGDIVGVKGGLISSTTDGAEQVLVISSRPAVLANMPDEGTEAAYEKVAFMGQVPVKVLGVVRPGDYILPSGRHDGFGRAVAPDALRPEQYGHIVGIAWSASERDGFNHVNVAVGLHPNAVSRLVTQQMTEIAALRGQLDRTQRVLAQLVPGYEAALAGAALAAGDAPGEPIEVRPVRVATAPAAPHVEMTREDLVRAIDLVERRMLDGGVDVDQHPFFARVRTDPEYKEQMIAGLVQRFNEARRSRAAER